jgi:DNA-directed RNA polymerase sigma subunit (sigma70/sigma32)
MTATDLMKAVVPNEKQLPEGFESFLLNLVEILLNKEEREVLTRHYGLYGRQRITLEEIGRIAEIFPRRKAVSRARVHQIKDRAIRRLRYNKFVRERFPMLSIYRVHKI